MTTNSADDADDYASAVVTQDAEGDNWYFDMRGAVVGLDSRKQLDELQHDLQHFREYLEEKKREWVRESILRKGDQGLVAALYTDMKLIRAQLESCKSAVIGHRGKPIASPGDPEWPRHAFDRLKPEFIRERKQRAEAALLRELTWKTRPAVFATDKFIVVLTNETDSEMRFTLRGYRLDGSFTDFSALTVQPNSRKEIGSLQGWERNWTKGERFEI